MNATINNNESKHRFSYKSVETEKLHSKWNYVPIANTIENMINIYTKAITLPQLTSDQIDKSYRYNCVKKESYPNLVILALPLIGTIFAIIRSLHFSHAKGAYSINEAMTNKKVVVGKWKNLCNQLTNSSFQAILCSGISQNGGLRTFSGDGRFTHYPPQNYRNSLIILYGLDGESSHRLKNAIDIIKDDSGKFLEKGGSILCLSEKDKNKINKNNLPQWLKLLIESGIYPEGEVKDNTITLSSGSVLIPSQNS